MRTLIELVGDNVLQDARVQMGLSQQNTATLPSDIISHLNFLPPFAVTNAIMNTPKHPLTGDTLKNVQRFLQVVF